MKAIAIEQGVVEEIRNRLVQQIGMAEEINGPIEEVGIVHKACHTVSDQSAHDNAHHNVIREVTEKDAISPTIMHAAPICH